VANFQKETWFRFDENAGPDIRRAEGLHRTLSPEDFWRERGEVGRCRNDRILLSPLPPLPSSPFPPPPASSPPSPSSLPPPSPPSSSPPSSHPLSHSRAGRWRACCKLNASAQRRLQSDEKFCSNIVLPSIFRKNRDRGSLGFHAYIHLLETVRACAAHPEKNWNSKFVRRWYSADSGHPRGAHKR